MDTKISETELTVTYQRPDGSTYTLPKSMLSLGAEQDPEPQLPSYDDGLGVPPPTGPEPVVTMPAMDLRPGSDQNPLQMEPTVLGAPPPTAEPQTSTIPGMTPPRPPVLGATQPPQGAPSPESHQTPSATPAQPAPGVQPSGGPKPADVTPVTQEVSGQVGQRPAGTGLPPGTAELPSIDIGSPLAMRMVGAYVQHSGKVGAEAIRAQGDLKAEYQNELAAVQKDLNRTLTGAEQEQVADAMLKKKKTEELFASHEKAVEDFASMHVDESRFWRKQTTGQQVGLMIMAAISGMGQAMKGEGSQPNSVLAMLDMAVKNDVASQQTAKDAAKDEVTMRKDLLDQYVDKVVKTADAAQALKVAAAQMVVTRKIEEIGQRYKGREEQLAAAQLAEKWYQEKVLPNLIDATEAEARTQLSAMKMLAKGTGGGGGTAGGFTAEGVVKIYDAAQGKFVSRQLTEDERKRQVSIPTANGDVSMLAATDKDAEVIKDKVSQMHPLVELLNEIEQIRKDEGSNVIPDERKAEVASKLETVLNLATNGVFKLGQKTKDEFASLKRWAGDPNATGYQLPKIQSAREDVDRILSGELRARVPGYKGGLQFARAATPQPDGFKDRQDRVAKALIPGGETEDVETVNVGTKKKPRWVERKTKRSLPDQVKSASTMRAEIDDLLDSPVVRNKTPEQRVEYLKKTVVPQMRSELARIASKWREMRKDLPADYTKDTPEQRERRDQSNRLAAGMQNYIETIRYAESKTAEQAATDRENKRILRSSDSIYPDTAGGI